MKNARRFYMHSLCLSRGASMNVIMNVYVAGRYGPTVGPVELQAAIEKCLGEK